VIQGQSNKLLKADMHCHSLHSGRAKHLRFLRCRDCYSRPLDVYSTAKRRGMDLVTITDHDSLDGCLELLERLGEREDFIPGEEVSATFPEFNHTVHLAVYGLNEAQHREIQRLRSNAHELVPYLRQQNLLFALNHFFHNFGDAERVLDFTQRMAELFDVFEIRNGSQERDHNTLIANLANAFRQRGRPVGIIGGSDSHTLRRLGRTYTVCPAAYREEFLEAIRRGRSQVCGAHSNHLSLAADIYGVVLRYYPAVFSFNNGELPAGVRVRNIFLSILAAPFLFMPYVSAARHSSIEHARVNRFARILASLKPSPYDRPDGFFGSR
jgi:predicted metal-dependent phosphoesterase TrpH